MTYRVIEDSIWDDPKVAALDSEAKLAFVYLVTNRQAHVSGIYVLPAVLAAHQTGMTPKQWDRVSDRVSELGLARFDHPRQVVWVVNMMRYQGRGEKNASSAAKHILTLHKSPLIKDFCEHYPDVGALVSDTVFDTVSLQEQEQEQDKEQKQEKENGLGAASAAARVWDFWIRAFKMNGTAMTLTKERKKKILTRLKTFTPEQLADSIRGFAAHPWWSESPDRFKIEAIFRNDSRVQEGLTFHANPERFRAGSKLTPGQQTMMNAKRAEEADDALKANLQHGDGDDGGGLWPAPDRGEAPDLLAAAQERPDGRGDDGCG